jgi:hypothetical protein
VLAHCLRDSYQEYLALVSPQVEQKPVLVAKKPPRARRKPKAVPLTLVA